MSRRSNGTQPVVVWRGLVERGMVERELGRAVLAPSRPMTDDAAWQHPLPYEKQIRLQQVRRANIGVLGRIARQHCWW